MANEQELPVVWLQGANEVALNEVPVTPGQVYFTHDGKIYFDTSAETRVRMCNGTKVTIVRHTED